MTRALSEEVTATRTDPRAGQMPPDLLPLAHALTSMKRADSGLTWIRQLQGVSP